MVSGGAWGRGPENAAIVLGLLNAVDQSANVTQRSVARDLGIALGLANAYLRRCARKGLIKIKQAPAKRYAYYLTPKGLAEKARLTTQYLTHSFSFFRTARQQCSDLFAESVERGWLRVALVGGGDLAEITTLCARDYPVEVVGLIDALAPPGRVGKMPVVPSMVDLRAEVDGVLITDLTAPQATYEAMAKALGAGRVLAPRLLNVRPVYFAGDRRKVGR